MATMAVLGDAALDARERELVDRFVSALERIMATISTPSGSTARARGERPHDESDIDVLAITRSERDDRPLIPTLRRVLSEMGNPPIVVDPRQRSRAWVEGRRAIASFFLRDVDRDKIVLFGDL